MFVSRYRGEVGPPLGAVAHGPTLKICTRYAHIVTYRGEQCDGTHTHVSKIIIYQWQNNLFLLTIKLANYFCFLLILFFYLNWVKRGWPIRMGRAVKQTYRRAREVARANRVALSLSLSVLLGATLYTRTAHSPAREPVYECHSADDERRALLEKEDSPCFSLPSSSLFSRRLLLDFPYSSSSSSILPHTTTLRSRDNPPLLLFFIIFFLIIKYF